MREVTVTHAATPRATSIRARLPLLLAAVAAVPPMGPRGAAAQEVWQADVRVTSVTVTADLRGQLSIQVAVYSDNDDTAVNARVEIFLPIGSAPQRIGSCVPSPSAVASLRARVTCPLGDLSPGQSRAVQFTASAPGPGLPRRVSAFAYSDTPDPVVANNYGEGSAP